MDTWKALKYVAVAVGLFVLLSVVVSVVEAVLGLAVAAIVAAVSLLVVLGVGYAMIKGILWLVGGSDDESRSTSTDAAPEDRVDRLTERYVDGEISEAELERRLESEMDGPEPDDIDRELEKSRSN